MTDHKRRGLGRGIALLAIVAMGAMAVTPAFSAAKLTKAKVKTIAQKQAKKILSQEIDDKGNPIFIQETELDRFEVRMTAGQADQVLKAAGGLSVKGQCTESGGNKTARAVVETTEANSTYASYFYGTEDDFDPADPSSPIIWSQATSTGATQSTSYQGLGHARTPSGSTLQGVVDAYAELGGQDCLFVGWFLTPAA